MNFLFVALGGAFFIGLIVGFAGKKYAGNWDDGIVKGSKNCLPGYEASHFFWDQLSKEQLAWLESLPFEDEVLISGLNFRIFHGRPTDQNYHSWLNSV